MRGLRTGRAWRAELWLIRELVKLNRPKSVIDAVLETAKARRLKEQTAGLGPEGEREMIQKIIDAINDEIEVFHHPMRGDLFRRQVYGWTAGGQVARDVLLEKCSQTQLCLANPKRAKLAGWICPVCHGAILTGKEIEFLKLRRVGRPREPGEEG